MAKRECHTCVWYTHVSACEMMTINTCNYSGPLVKVSPFVLTFFDVAEVHVVVASPCA